MGLPSRSAVRSTDVTIAGLELRFTAFLGDSRVYLSPSGSESPRAGEVDRIDNGTIQTPRLQILNTALIPGLPAAAEAVKAVAADFYRHPDNYEPATGTAPVAVTTGSE